jgi:hypothetical protein
MPSSLLQLEWRMTNGSVRNVKNVSVELSDIFYNPQLTRKTETLGA